MANRVWLQAFSAKAPSITEQTLPDYWTVYTNSDPNDLQIAKR